MLTRGDIRIRDKYSYYHECADREMSLQELSKYIEFLQYIKEKMSKINEALK